MNKFIFVVSRSGKTVSNIARSSLDLGLSVATLTEI